MNKFYGEIAMDLYTISRYRNPDQDAAQAKLLTCMMIQIAEIYHTGNKYDSESAELYFLSEDFISHCFTLGLDSDVVYRLLVKHSPDEAIVGD